MRFLFVFLLLLAACGDDDGVLDASFDANRPDVPAERDAARDSGPACLLSCGLGEECCIIDGEAACIDTATDFMHCGSCSRSCEGGRGTMCELGNCVCGLAVQGCGGDVGNTCCPPRVDGSLDYCANLRSDGEDCGGCNQRCDPLAANGCDNGTCLCGDETACDGTPESTCCASAVGEVSCTDLTTTTTACGRCGNACRPGHRCTHSICTIGEGECTDCNGIQVCCGGTCCAPGLCVSGECTEGA